jgi:hypothetical protein
MSEAALTLEDYRFLQFLNHHPELTGDEPEEYGEEERDFDRFFDRCVDMGGDDLVVVAMLAIKNARQNEAGASEYDGQGRTLVLLQAALTTLLLRFAPEHFTAALELMFSEDAPAI